MLKYCKAEISENYISICKDKWKFVFQENISEMQLVLVPNIIILMTQ